jgi:ceramide glucosyltransferase
VPLLPHQEIAVLCLGLGFLSLALIWWCQSQLLCGLAQALPARSSRPPISVLKPLKGMDDELYANLVSLAQQDYPDFELLFGVADADDPALPQVRALQRQFPALRMRLVVRRNVASLNPKVGNLLNLLPLARHELLLISDSNVAVAPDYLQALADAIAQPGVGLVSNVFAGTGEQSLGAALENLHLNALVAPVTATADRVGDPVVIGKSMLMRRADLERAGGLESVKDLLAEDYVLGKRFHALGLRVVLSRHLVRTVNRRWPLSRFLSRHLRWAQLRRWCALGPFLIEPLAYPAPLLLLAAVLARAAGMPVAFPRAALLGIVLKLVADAALVTRLRGTPPTLLALTLSPLKDCLLLLVWCIAAVRRTVQWRGHLMRIGPGTTLEPVGGTTPRGTLRADA